MTATKKNGDISRREFLNMGWALGAGLALPAGLVGCGGSHNSTLLRPGETFVEPRTLASANGLLEVTLTLGYLRTTLNGKSVNLRSMGASIPGPTLRVNPGDTLRILLDNKLPPNPPSDEPATHLRYPNSTNLHTHGLHVDPGILAPGIYGDYVVDDPASAVQPGQTRQHLFNIGQGHPPGAYFYHPHLHGSTAIQMGSGMAGALIVGGGEINRVPEIQQALERVFMFQAPITDAEGNCESFALVADNPTKEGPFLINGVRRPRIVMYRGEVQNWHFVNAGIFNFMNLALDGHALNIYSMDGNTRRNMKPTGPGASVEGVVLAPGNRTSVLVQAGRAGTYLLRNLRFQVADVPATVAEDILAEVVILDDALNMSLPAGPLPVPAALAPITDQELAAAGGLKRSIALRAVFDEPRGPPKPPITAEGIRNPDGSYVIRPGDELHDWVFNTGLPPKPVTSLSNTVFAMSSVGEAASTNPGFPVEFIPFQSRRALKQTVALGSVEEWTIFNMNNVRHPFHIHVNPVMIVRINDQPVEPYWVDTFALPLNGTPANPTSITFRTRFEDFRGPTVMHCHMLVHEDMGMMQMVDIV